MSYQEALELLCESVRKYTRHFSEQFGEQPRRVDDDNQLAFYKHAWNEDLVDQGKLSLSDFLPLRERDYFNCEDVKMILPAVFDRLVKEGYLLRTDQRYLLNTEKL